MQSSVRLTAVASSTQRYIIFQAQLAGAVTGKAHKADCLHAFEAVEKEALGLINVVGVLQLKCKLCCRSRG